MYEPDTHDPACFADNALAALAGDCEPLTAYQAPAAVRAVPAGSFV